MSETKHILIAGGGYTGLSAAWRLSALPDCTVEVVESSATLGGLAGGCRIAGTSIEKTYHHIFRTDTEVIRLADEIGASACLHWLDSSMGVYLGGKIHPFTTPLDLLRFAPCSLSGRLRTGATIAYLQKRKNWRTLAAQSASAWMRRACGASAMRTIWAPLLSGKFDRHAEEVSMAWLWARIHTRANSRRKGGEQLGYFRGGFSVLTDALARALVLRGVHIRIEAPVEAFDEEARRARIAGQWEDFDACLFTGPCATFARLMPPRPGLDQYRRKLESIRYLGAVSLVFSSDQVLGDRYWLNINEPGAPFLVFLRHTRLVAATDYNNRQIYYLGAYLAEDNDLARLQDGELIRIWFAYLRRIFPSFDPAQVRERHLFRFAAAQHIADTGYEPRIPASRTPLPGVLLSNFAQIYPEDRGVNFAVRAGFRIAGQIAADLGLAHTAG